MSQHLNFYENLKEANMRLRGTVVLYDGVPYYIIVITNHKGDGIFRAYMHPLPVIGPLGWVPLPNADVYPTDGPELGQYLDKWMVDNPSTKLVRKYLSSPQFNKFRPFPLGMCNIGTTCYYVERQPQRRTEQGLTRNMLSFQSVVLKDKDSPSRPPIELFGEEVRQTIVGEYPSPQETLNKLLDPRVENLAVGFHRHFALIRGPLEMLFLGHKGEVIGILGKNDFSSLRLGKKFLYLSEIVAELGLFSNIES